MQEILLQFSERVVLLNAMQELAQHQTRLQHELSLRKHQPDSCKVVADLGGLKEIDTSVLALMLHLDRQVVAALNTPLVIRSAPANLVALAKLSSLFSALQWE